MNVVQFLRDFTSDLFHLPGDVVETIEDLTQAVEKGFSLLGQQVSEHYEDLWTAVDNIDDALKARAKQAEQAHQEQIVAMVTLTRHVERLVVVAEGLAAPGKVTNVVHNPFRRLETMPGRVDPERNNVQIIKAKLSGQPFEEAPPSKANLPYPPPSKGKARKPRGKK